jgi:phage gp16-like protein
MAAIPAWNPDARKARIKIIKAIVGPKGLALDDGTYRTMLANLVGKSSLTDCSVVQLDKVLAHVKRQAGQPVAVPKKGDADEWRFVFKCVPDRQAHLRKIFRLAERCGKLLTPPVPVASKGWVEGTAAQMVGCTTALEFCDPELLHKIVQAFEIHCKRHGV